MFRNVASKIMWVRRATVFRLFNKMPLKIVGLFVLLGFVSMPISSTAQAVPLADQPNILFILTDDQDMRSMNRMPELRNQLKKKGTTFNNAFATTSQCCPSRASFLTGKYAHNHTVYTNKELTGGAPKFRRSGEDRSTAARWLDQQGYQTIHIGKYLNFYRGKYIPPGWDQWRGQMGLNNDHRYNINGTVKYFNPEKYHDTDLFSNWASRYIRNGAGKKRPFFMYLSVNPPHYPDDGAPRHERAYSKVKLPKPPNFNERDMSDKPLWMRKLPPLDAAVQKKMTERHRDRLRSMLSVDEMIGRLVRELHKSGELKNTYIIFTSDHGYHVGQHRLPYGKTRAYEEDIRIPLVVRGPGVPQGRTLQHKVLNIDFAPTFAELGGAGVPAATDGRSFVRLLGSSPPPAGPWRQSFLVEFFQGNAYSALRTERYTYVEYVSGERELYDLTTDPYQLRSLHALPEYQVLMEKFHTRLENLKNCSGQASCKAAESEAPEVQPVDPPHEEAPVLPSGGEQL